MTLFHALFVLELGIASLALGKLLVFAPRWLPAPRASRFVVGASLAPFFVAGCVGLLAALYPGAPAALHLALPLIGSGLLLALSRGSLPAACTKALERRTRTDPNPRLTLLLYGLALVAAVPVATVLVANAGIMVTGEDALKYLEEARYFATERSLAALPSFDAPAGGNVPSSSHSPAYQLLLALALLCSPGDVIGYPDDAVVRSVVQILIVYMLLATGGLAGLARRPGVAPLAMLALLSAASYWGFSMVQTRDAYRIVAVVLFATVLFAGGGRRRRVTELGLLTLMTALAVMAHTVNLTALAFISLGYGAVGLLRGRLAPVLQSATAIALGGILGGAHYLLNLVGTGRLFGDLPNYGLRDTVVWDAIAGDRRFVEAAALTLGERFEVIFAGQGVAISVLGLIGAFAVLGLALWRGCGSGSTAGWAPAPLAVLLSAAVIALYIPVLGVLDWLSPLPFSSYLTTNMRYMAHAQPFAAALIACATLAALPRPGRAGSDAGAGAGNPARIAKTAISAITAVVIAGSGVYTVHARWQVLPERQQQAFAAMTAVMNQAIGDTEGLVLVGRDYIRYYLDARTAAFGYPQAWPLLKETDPSRIPGLLAGLGVTHVMVEEARARERWDRLALLRYLESSDTVERMVPLRGLRIYRLGPAPVAGQSDAAVSEKR